MDGIQAQGRTDLFADVYHRLAAHYGPSEPLHQDSPTIAGETVLDSLIATMLTQATTDRTAIRAFHRLKESFPGWEQVLSQPEQVIADRIAVAGLANEKAGRIISALREIQRQFGRLSLEELRLMSPEETRSFLLSLPGVGAKTAACVQAFALRQDAFPVDTHVYRILQRLGWVDDKLSPVKVQDLMERNIPREFQSELHVYLIHHGRFCCQARKPGCGQCPLTPVCEKHGIGLHGINPD